MVFCENMLMRILVSEQVQGAHFVCDENIYQNILKKIGDGFTKIELQVTRKRKWEQ